MEAEFKAEAPKEKTMDFEDLLEAVGSYGKFQQRLMWGFLIPIAFTVPFLCMNQIFLMAAPDHWCRQPVLSSEGSLSTEDKMLLLRPKDAQNGPDKCRMYNLSYGQVLGELSSTGQNVSYFVETYSGNWSTVKCENGWDYDKSLYRRTVTTDYNLVCDDDYYPSLVYTLITIGSSIGTPIFGAISDKVGRRVSFFGASVIGVISAILTVAIPSFTGFLVIRAINGTLLPSVFQLPYLILVEIVSPEMRTRANGVACMGWTVGLALMPLFAWLTADWVWFGWLCAVASFPYVFYYWVLPESPRWLITQERFEEADAVFQRLARVNGKDISHLDMISLMKKYALKSKETEGMKSSPIEFLKKPNLCKRFIFITVAWSADAVAYYGFHLNVGNLYGNEFFNFFLLALVEFPSYLLTWYMMESRLGRRWTNVIFLFLTAIVCLLPIMSSEESTVLSTVASLVGKFGVSASFMVMYQQSAEIFPTPLRASGMGIAGTIANLVSIATPGIIYLSIYGRHIPYTVMALLSLLAGICALFIPETLNESLPQSVQDGEDFGKDKPFFSLANTKKTDALTRQGTVHRMSIDMQPMSARMNSIKESSIKESSE